MFDQHAANVAHLFDLALKSEIGEENYDEVVRLNRTPEYSTGCCASHNFCDANMVMSDVLKTIGVDEESDAGNSLWNRSWEAWRVMTR